MTEPVKRVKSSKKSKSSVALLEDDPYLVDPEMMGAETVPLAEEPLRRSRSSGDTAPKKLTPKYKFSLWVALFAVVVAVAVLAGVLFGWIKTKPDDTVTKFVVLGNWGQNGGYNQTQVAEAMAWKAGHMTHARFVISTGDSFWNTGLYATFDPQFSTSFTDVYKQGTLQKQWYAVLGERDYGSGAAGAQNAACPAANNSCFNSPVHLMSIELPKRDSRWNLARAYKQTFSDHGGDVDIFFMDTSPFIDEYRKEAFASLPGGLAEQSWLAQLTELETQLAESKALWKLVVGHHTPRSNGAGGNWPTLIERLEPLLEKYKVRGFFGGHDLDLEHVHINNTWVHYINSGAGAQAQPLVTADNSVASLAEPGFVAVTLQRDFMITEFYNTLNNTEPDYRVRITRDMTADGF